METRLIRRLPSNWSQAILVCGKCSKKIGGGFGPKGKASLAKALRKKFGLKKGRKSRAGVCETRCLGVCPRRAVTIARAREWLVVQPGADLDELGAILGLEPPAPPGDQA